MIKKLKLLIRRGLELIFRFIPFSILTKVVKGSPRLAICLPQNKKFVFAHYLDDIKINVDTIYPIEKEIVSGLYDPDTLAVIRRYVDSNNICFDIGANIGAISFALAKEVQPDGKVFSFEPGPFIYQRLINNLQLNNEYKEIITPINIGLSDNEGCLSWNEDTGNRGNAGCIDIKKDGSIKIKVTTLDNFMTEKKIQKVDFIKIDVEGMELEVIMGGLETLKKIKPIIYFETRIEFEEIRNQKVLLEIENALTKLGYNLYSTGPKNKLENVQYPNFKANALAVHKEHNIT